MIFFYGSRIGLFSCSGRGWFLVDECFIVEYLSLVFSFVLCSCVILS